MTTIKIIKLKLKYIAIVILVIGGAILAFAFNFFLLDPILIPDPCYYHMHKPGRVFSIFYNLSDGGHPFPTTFNFIFTLVAGGLLGWLLAKRIIKTPKT